jgi:predicted transcriptional regulator
MKPDLIQELITTQKNIEIYKQHHQKLTSEFGKELRKFRINRHLSVRRFIAELGISTGFYYDMEKGFRKPNAAILAKLKEMI